MSDAHPSEQGAVPAKHGAPSETLPTPPTTNSQQVPPPPGTITYAQSVGQTASFVGAAAHGDELPARIGRYSIRRMLGRGGMGAVYLAHDPELDRPVALKVPRLSGPDAEERFLREARAPAALKHENVCPVYEIGRADGVLYLVMAYIPGPTLTEVLRTAGPLPIERACSIAIGIARGVAEAHRHGIVHRDLKPGNVLMDARRGREGDPVVTDFGLALRAGPVNPTPDAAPTLAPGVDPRLTQVGAIMGTPAYMPPEQARGDIDRVGRPADVYALGAILYELLTGDPPFHAGTVHELIGKIEADPPRPPSAARPGLPGGLDAVVLRALAKEPHERFESMDAFAGALAPFAAPPQRRRRFAVALAAIAALLVLAGGVIFYVQTDAGTVEVRLNDPTADVKVSVDGKEITVADGTRVTRLRAGPHALEVKGPDFETETRVFKITRGDKTVVEIELKPKEKVAGKPPVDPKKPNDPVKPVIDPPGTAVAVAPAPHEPVPVDPKRVRLAQLLASGKELVRKGRQPDLGPIVTEALAIDPESPGALALRATLRHAHNDLIGAKADADAALKLNPETFQALLLKSQFAGADGKWDEDIAYATCAIRLDPNSGAAWSNRALAYHRKGEHRQAIVDATHSIAVARGFVSPYLTRGAAHASLGEYEKALADYDAVAKIAPTNSSVFVQRSRVYDKTGEKEKSDADWKTAQALAKRPLVRDEEKAFPNPPKPVERKKLTAEERADFDTAVATFDRAWTNSDISTCRRSADDACRIDDTSAEALVRRARVRYEDGKRKESLADATRATRLAPTLSMAYAVRGAAQNALGNPAAAIADHTIGLTLDGKNTVALSDRAWAFIQQEQYHQALFDVEASMRLRPDPVGYGNRGLCRVYLGDTKGALADYETLAELRPSVPKWWMVCALLKNRLGDSEGAAKYRKRALDNGWNPDAPPPELPTQLPPVKRDPDPVP